MRIKNFYIIGKLVSVVPACPEPQNGAINVRITTLSIMKLSIMTLRIMKLSIMKLSTQHNEIN